MRATVPRDKSRSPDCLLPVGVTVLLAVASCPSQAGMQSGQISVSATIVPTCQITRPKASTATAVANVALHESSCNAAVTPVRSQRVYSMSNIDATPAETNQHVPHRASAEALVAVSAGRRYQILEYRVDY